MTYAQKLEDLKDDPIWEKLEKDKPCKDKTVYTASFLKQIQRCEFAADLEFNKLAIPQSRNIQGCRGTIVHAAINTLHRFKKWDDWGDLYDQEWAKEMADPDEGHLPWSNKNLTEKDIETIEKDGAIMLGQYVERNRDAIIIGSEVPFRMILEHPRTGTRYRFSGTADQLRETALEHSIYPWDNKTSAQVPDKTALYWDPQFTLYGLACAKGVWLIDGEEYEIGTYPDQLVWYHIHHLLPYKKAGKRSDGSKYVKGDLRGDPIVPVPRTMQQYETFQDDVFRTVQKIRMGILTRQPDSIKCSMCRHSHACATGQYAQHESLADVVSMEV